MAARVDPKFKHELLEFGLKNIEACFNCGSCTAVCAHSDEAEPLPRSAIRKIQLGLQDELAGSLSPWLCYYCGDCSTTCPRDANPAENMMALRRWLTSRYDWTGISRRLYLSTAGELGTLGVLALVVLAVFAVGGAFQPSSMPTESVSINTFAPVTVVHYGDWVLAGILTLALALNTLRMIRFAMGGGRKLRIPLSTYLKEIPTFVIHTVTQKRWLDCRGATRWFQHFLLVTGYGTMFLLVVVFLSTFQRDGAEFHWSSIFGYYGTLTLLFISGDALVSRFRKREELHKYSHPTDYMYLVLLFLTALSGILLHLFRLANFPLTAYFTYVIHLAIAVPMLIVEVPFGKWAHLLYRPLAMYLVRVRARALTEAPPAAVVHARAA
jgi:quinone-modifying oxidoreductase, subunit QmoC